MARKVKVFAGGRTIKTTKRAAGAVEKIEHARIASTTELVQGLMKLAPTAIKFKEDLLNDDDAPRYLKLSNANDILDRTVPKPTQNINMQSTIHRTDLTSRELRQLVMQKMAAKGIIEIPSDQYEVEE